MFHSRRFMPVAIAVIAIAAAAGFYIFRGPVEKEKGIVIVASLFPQYDFARNIAGDRAKVVMLLPPGMDSHTFDPRPGDIKEIYDADVFVYTGKYMEPWADRIIAAVPAGSPLTVLDASIGIKMEEAGGEHDEDGEEDGGHGIEAHEGSFDPHIWLDMKNAAVMVDNITEALCGADAANADFYRKNALKYKAELAVLDKSISDLASRQKKALVFGGKFAYRYFLGGYGFEYVTVNDSCSVHSEPSVKDVARVIKYIKDNGVKYVYHEELTEPRTAKAVAASAGAAATLFSTVHNVTPRDFKSGVTFIELMNENLGRIRRGIE